jgi:hypothetical protein
MMTVEEVLNTKLATATGCKVYPTVKAEKAVLPALVYRRISYYSRRSQSGLIDIKRARYQIDIFATTFKQVCELAELTKTFFECNVTDWELSYTLGETELTEEFLFRKIIEVIIEYK